MQIEEKSIKDVIHSWLENKDEKLIFLSVGQGKTTRTLGVIKKENLIWFACPNKFINSNNNYQEAYLWGLISDSDIRKKIYSRNITREELIKYMDYTKEI